MHWTLSLLTIYPVVLCHITMAQNETKVITFNTALQFSIPLKDMRRRFLLRGLEALSADVACLQEETRDTQLIEVTSGPYLGAELTHIRSLKHRLQNIIKRREPKVRPRWTDILLHDQHDHEHDLRSFRILYDGYERYAFTIHGVVGTGVYVTSQQQPDATHGMEYKFMHEKPHLKFNTAYISCLRSLFTQFSTSEMKPGLEGCILTQSGLEKVTPQKYFQMLEKPQKPEKYKTNSTVEVVQGDFINMPHISRVRPNKQPKDKVLQIIVRKLEPSQHESHVSVNKNHKSSPDQMQRLDGKEQKKSEKSLDDKEAISAQKARAISPRAPPPTAVCKRKRRTCARHDSTNLARIAQEYSKSVSYVRVTKSHQNCGPQKISRDLDILALYKKIKKRISLI